VQPCFGKSPIKRYIKSCIVLRIETTASDVAFFRHHRPMEHRNRRPARAFAPVRTFIYSLIDLRQLMVGRNGCHLAHLSAQDDFSAQVRALGRLTKPRDGKAVKGINFFEPGDSTSLHALQSPRTNIAGIRRAIFSQPLVRCRRPRYRRNYTDCRTSA
jgi:hypothetical protein